jgi:hypothetical protein
LHLAARKLKPGSTEIDFFAWYAPGDDKGRMLSNALQGAVHRHAAMLCQCLQRCVIARSTAASLRNSREAAQKKSDLPHGRYSIEFHWRCIHLMPVETTNGYYGGQYIRHSTLARAGALHTRGSRGATQDIQDGAQARYQWGCWGHDSRQCERGWKQRCGLCTQGAQSDQDADGARVSHQLPPFPVIPSRSATAVHSLECWAPLSS